MVRVITQEIYEGFEFAGQNTQDWNLSLMDRQAPTPEEKKITENLPFTQGETDFSFMLGERIYNNREINYQFEMYDWDYSKRGIAEIKLKGWLMTTNKPQPLYDTHIEGYYWLGKFSSVQVTDGHTEGRLIVNLTFDAYPFMISILPEGHDLWDPFNFRLDIFQDVEFSVFGSLDIVLYNVGNKSVVPTIEASNAMTIVKNGVTYSIQAGKTSDDLFRLDIGENPMTVTGDGTIKFEFYKELMG